MHIKPKGMSFNRYFLIISVVFFQVLSLSAQSDWNQINDLVDYKDQLKQYLKEIDSKPGDHALEANIGEAYFMLNQMSEARTWFEKALSQIPLKKKNQLQYAQTLTALEDYAAAKNWFLMYAESVPEVGKHFASNIDIIEEMNKIAPIFSTEALSINSNHAELSPCLLGNRLYFLSKSSYGTKLAYGDIDDKGQNFVYKGEINTGVNLNEVASFSFSRDRKWVTYAKQKSFSNQRQIPEAGIKSSIHIAEVRADGGWINSTNFEYNNAGFNVFSPSFGEDGQTLYFSSDRIDGFGGMDIYISQKVGGKWSFPENAGSIINSPGHEIYPYHNGSSLYFSSNWHEGYGGYDLFRAEMQGNTGSKVFHQGSNVNSSRDEYGIQMLASGENGFFVSNRLGGLGLADIYTIGKKGSDYNLVVVDQTHSTFIEGAMVDMSLCGGTSALTDARGVFTFQLNKPGNCEMIIKKDGYQEAKLVVSESMGTVYTVSLMKLSGAVSSSGVVINPVSGQGVGEVIITASNRQSGAEKRTISDQNGNYTLALKAKQSYIVSFSKAGFETLNKSISTGVEVSGDVLGVTALAPFNSGVADTSIPSSPTPSQTQSPTYPSTTSPNTSIETAPSSLSKNGFAVQIAAIRPNKQIDLNQYSSLNSTGNVFVENGADYNRVRVGFFNSRAEADAARNKIKSLGYPSAYVVEQKSKISSQATVMDYPDTTIDKSPHVYRIRLAALQNASNFNYELVQKYGQVETTVSNGFTVFFLSGIQNEKTGLSSLQALQANGFPDAQLLVKKNGIFTKVR